MNNMKDKQALEEEYYAIKKTIQKEKETLDKKLARFKRETQQLIDKVLYLTKDDEWNKQQFYNDMEQRNNNVNQIAQRCVKYLEDKEQKLKKEYQIELD